MSSRLAGLLISAASIGISSSLFFGYQWWHALHRQPVLADMSADERKELAEKLLGTSPGIFAATWYDPRIAYTLKPDRRITAWGDRFTSNRLGYRSGPVEKAPGVFRIVFVGDSWTYGLGVRQEESFPKQLERLANAHAGFEARVEAWTLALSGYNTFNELAALETFQEALEPDLVVICPTINDVDSSHRLLSNGSMGRSLWRTDHWGSDHGLRYHDAFLNSHTYLRRWRVAMQSIRSTQAGLRQQGIPSLLFFAANWDEGFVHRLVEAGELDSPYVITPLAYTTTAWQNPLPEGHGTPEANRIFAQMVYRGIQQLLEWQDLPAPPETLVFQHPPPGAWRERSDAFLATRTRDRISESYSPGRGHAAQCIGPMDCVRGAIGRATTILVRRAEGAKQLVISLKRLPRTPSLYPLRLTASIASASGGTQAIATLMADGSETQNLYLDIPEEILPGTALDVTLRASRATLSRGALGARSLFVARITQK